MTFGTPVWFRPPRRGGYGFDRDIPALFVRASAQRFIFDQDIGLQTGTVAYPTHRLMTLLSASLCVDLRQFFEVWPRRF